MRTSFTEIKALIRERFGEPEESGPIEATFDLPWVEDSDLERVILRCVHDMLREVPRTELETFGTDAEIAFTVADNSTMPLPVIRIVSVSASSGGPVEPVSEAAWFQRSANPTQNYVWSMIGGQIRMNAPQLFFSVVEEHSAADLENDLILLPDGSDRDLIERVMQWLKFSRNMEVGRA